MSIFSGFATRKQEERYNNYVVTLITLLQDKIVELMGFCRCSNMYEFQLDLKESLRKIATHMRDMEKSKYLPPKISPLLATILDKCDTEVTIGRCNSQEKSALGRSQDQPNVRITVKSSAGHPRSISRSTRRKRIYEMAKSDSQY
jgi:hypothetical protein